MERENSWQSIAKHLGINSKFKFPADVCRLGYYYLKDELPPIKLFQRRFVDLGEGLHLPLHATKDLNIAADSVCIGQESLDDDDESELYTTEEWVKVFIEKPLVVYLGTPISVPIILHGKTIKAHGVQRNIIPVLIQHLVQCSKRGYIKNGKTDLVACKIIDWMDGTSMLNQSMLKVIIRVLWDPDIFELNMTS